MVGPVIFSFCNRVLRLAPSSSHDFSCWFGPYSSSGLGWACAGGSKRFCFSFVGQTVVSIWGGTVVLWKLIPWWVFVFRQFSPCAKGAVLLIPHRFFGCILGADNFLVWGEHGRAGQDGFSVFFCCWPDSFPVRCWHERIAKKMFLFICFASDHFLRSGEGTVLSLQNVVFVFVLVRNGFLWFGASTFEGFEMFFLFCIRSNSFSVWGRHGCFCEKQASLVFVWCHTVFPCAKDKVLSVRNVVPGLV